MRSKRTMVAIIVTVFSLITSRPLRAATKDACSLLTQAQVSAALGVTVKAGTHVVPNLTQMCGWSAGHTPGLSKRVVVTLSTQEKFTRGKTPYQGITKVPVSGISNDAYFVTAAGLGTTLNVLKGNSAFSVSVKGEHSVEKVKSLEKTLALEIVSRL
ncbi:MAG: hypothetical protein EPN47_00150 [Acidobacteria bacterium]|nr:MAG: hypothetical protein EPN47_00150 [Acidobacteriota bacterium]